MVKVVCKPLIIDAPWTPSPLISVVSSLHHHPHLIKPPFTVAPQHDCHHIPQPAASLGNGELGD